MLTGSVLAIIPARGGSKGLPGKNIKKLGDKPLIAWTIEAAQNSIYVTDIVVSTDDVAIAEVAQEYGAEVPTIRPKHLATDEAKSTDAVLHMIEYLESIGRKYDQLLLLQPTSPFRDAEDIDAALGMLTKNNDSIISFVEVETKPFWMVTPREDGSYERLLKDDSKFRRQEFPKVYQYNGALYCVPIGEFTKHRKFEFDSTLLFPMSKEKSLDIDTVKDWEKAETILELHA